MCFDENVRASEYRSVSHKMLAIFEASDGVAAERDGVGLPEDDVDGLPAGVTRRWRRGGVRVRRRGANISVIIHTHTCFSAQAQDSYAGSPVPLPLPPGPPG